MSTLSPFVFEGSQVIRTFERDGDPWFVGKDIATALGYADTDKAVRMHCRKAETSPAESAGQVRHLAVIPESDVYRLIMRSNKPEAERFQDWICEEVIPSIRKTGSYVFAEGAERAMLLRETEETMARLRERRDAMNLELRRLEKRRRRLGGETILPGYAPAPKLSPEDILAGIPDEGIRVAALERLICERFECVRTTFSRPWRILRISGKIQINNHTVTKRG